MSGPDGSFLEDPAQFTSSEPPNTEVVSSATTDVVGSARSSDGFVAVQVDVRGRVDSVQLSPELFVPGATDPEGVAGTLTTVFNAALDDLDDQLRVAADSSLQGMETNLGEIGSRFEQALEKVSADIAAAQRRLDGR